MMVYIVLINFLGDEFISTDEVISMQKEYIKVWVEKDPERLESV